MGKILRPILQIAAIAVNFIPGLGQLASLAITAGLTLASAALAPKAPKVSPAQRERLYATIDPSTPRKIVFGQTAMATDIRYEEWSGTNQEYLDRIVVVASHKVQAIEEIWFDDKLAWTSAGGVQSPYSGYLTVQTRLEGSAGNTIAINGGSKWGSSRRLTGCAYVHLRYKTTGNSKKTESPFASSIPQRMTIKGKGALLYDPRLDSTVGGSGSQRADDQSTWAWTSDAAGNNPALQMLWYLLGWRINGKLAVGRGIPKSRILMSAFIAAANLCEEAVSLAAGGSEPRYRSAGVVSEADAPSAVIDAIEASCAGTLRDASGRLALDILHNDLATALSPGLTDADVIGQCDWQQTKSLDESFNVVRGRYTDPSNNALYQLVDYPAVSLPSPDGLERIHVFDLSMVQSASQAQRLAKQELQRAQYQGVFKGEFKATAWRCQVGSIVPFTFSALGFSNKLFRVVEQVVRMDGTCGLVLREENAAIYAWATEETAPVQAAAPTPYDPNNSPLIQGIVEGDNPNSLTINEKISDRIPKENERSGTNGRYPTVRARMVALGLSVTALDNASAAWIAHRDAVPGWNNTSFHSTIVRTTWDALDKAFDDQLNLGDIAISQEDAKRAVVGGGVTDTYGNPVALDQVRNNLALVDWWKRLAAVPWAFEWPNVSRQIISVPNDFNIPGPVAGRPDDVMFCADTNGGGGFGGGWEPTAADGLHLAPLDPDKTYRFALPFRKPSGNGGVYWGTLNVADLNTGTLNTNPYFVGGWTGYQTDRWYLAVGYIYPRNSVGRTHDGAGVFDLKTGAKVATGLNFCFHPLAAQPNHRAFQYYATIANSQVVFGRPLVNLVDGTEPSLREYFETGAVLNSAIQIDANGNFVNPVGTGSGTNVSNALVANKLTSRGSTAAIIEGNSIRRSSGNSDYNCFVSGQQMAGACFAEVIIVGGWNMIALDPVATTGYYGDQDFVVHVNSGGEGNIYSNGVSIASGLSAPTIGQTMRVTYDGTRYQVFLDGVQYGPDVPAGLGKSHFAIFNAYNGPGAYLGLNYGPYSQTSAETKFIVQTSAGPTLRLIGANAFKRDGASNWNEAQCYSDRGFESGAFCSFSPTNNNCYFMAGLNSDPLTNPDYTSLDYAFHMNGGAAGLAGEIFIYESGVQILAPNGTPWGIRSDGTVLSIIYDNEYIRYLIDGEEVRCIRTTNGRKFHFDSSVVGGDAVANLRFGPVTPDAASVDFVHLVSNQSQQGNSVYKNIKHNPGWNSKSTSRQMQRGNAVVSAKMPTPGTFFGLHQLGNGNASYTSLAWSFHRSENGEWYIFENGSAVGFLATSSNGVTFGNETEFRIEYDGVRVRYWADGVLMREVTSGVSMNVSYQAGVAIDGNGRRVSNIHFGAFTDNAWPNVGGSGRPEDNATVGATAGTNLRRSNNAVVGDAEVLNEAQQWSQVQSKDVWLTDGRIPTGIDAAGRSQVGIVGGSGAVVPNIDLMGTPNGLNLAINPEFMDGGVTDWAVYNNAGGSKVTRTIIADATAPNASGYILRVAYDGTGTEGIDPTPGFGGVYQYLDDALNMTGNARARPGRYARGSTIIYSIIARIPVGRTLGFHTNSFGAEGSFEWLTPVAGTGNWQRYVGRQKIGVTGTFQSTSYFAIGGGPNSAFTWDIAKCDQIDITSSPRLFLGRNGLSREDGLPLFDADVRNQLQQWTDIQGSLKPENNADVTSYITGSAKIIIECDANGTPLSGQLTKTTVYKLLKNGIDETVNATWSSTVLSGTLTQSTANTGVNSISAISTATAKIRISATLGSAVRSFDVDVEKRLAAPETGGSGSGGTAATVPVNLSSNSTTMVTASNELIFNTGSAGSATMTGIVYFTTDGGPPHGSWSAYWIWQRWNGSTWVDVDSEVAAVQSAVVSREWDGTDWFYYDSQNGELHVGKVITGLSANSQVKFRLRVRSAGGLRTLYYNTFGVNIGGQGS